MVLTLIVFAVYYLQRSIFQGRGSTKKLIMFYELATLLLGISVVKIEQFKQVFGHLYDSISLRIGSLMAFFAKW